MDQSPKFCSGLELADLVVNSDILSLSWKEIENLHREVNPNEQVRYRVHQQPNCTVIAFASSPTQHHLLKEKGTEAAISLFDLLLNNNQLSNLKNQCGNSCPWIITGHSLGGSVASLFALWLLESVNRPANKPLLCITFGSPLIGDSGFQKAMSERSTWSSCFLHVVDKQDPTPRIFISPHNPSQTGCNYQPFGTFLLFSEWGGCTCVEDPETVSNLLMAMGLDSANNQEFVDYGRIVEHLKKRIMFKGVSQLDELDIRDSLRAGIILQLEAIGAKRIQEQLNGDTSALIEKIQERENFCMLSKRKAFDPAKKLNDMKIDMVYFEWYKKDPKTRGIGYYDRYKNKQNPAYFKISVSKKSLTMYWKKMVEEAERKPQKEAAAFRTRWLLGGTNYRRMVEPLDIAEYYSETGKRDYQTNGRSKHYKQLEQWLEEAEKPPGGLSNGKKQNVEAILTEDSSFWANVEEALISCKAWDDAESGTMEKEAAREALTGFEDYVMQQLKNYAVSTEIFWARSSFMKWWEKYDEITKKQEYSRTQGSSYSSRLTLFMRHANYHQYTSGKWVWQTTV